MRCASANLPRGGLDVYETEDNQIFEDYSDDMLRSVVVPVLLSFPNVVITSHQAFLPAPPSKYCYNDWKMPVRSPKAKSWSTLCIK